MVPKEERQAAADSSLPPAEQDPELVNDQQCADGAQIAGRMVDFSACATAFRSLLPLAGVRLEHLRLQVKKRSRAHPSRQQLKPLSSLDSKFYDLRGQSKRPGDASERCQTPVFTFVKHCVRQFACGISHCVALVDTENGDALFSWGAGMYGQLGLGDQQVADTMTRIDSSPDLQKQLQVTDVALRCGPFASFLLVKNTSVVWHWGLLPSTTTSDRFVLQGVPVQFPMLDSSLEITGIAVGVEHIVLLSALGQVFTWGFGASGQLGLGHERTEIVSENAQPVGFSQSVEQLKIVAIACGWHHSLALASDHSVYAWGSNRLGACGVTTKFHEYFAPVRVPIQPRAPKGNSDEQRAISCCGNTSVVTTRSRSSGMLTSAFIWGVCSESMAVLMPVEVPDVRHQGRFAECQAGFGVLHGVYQISKEISEHGNLVSDHCLLQIQKAQTSSATGDSVPRRQLPESIELLAFDLEPNEAVSLRLTSLLSDKDLEKLRLPTDRLMIREVQNSKPNDAQKLMKLVKPVESEQVGALVIQMRAVVAGSANIELTYDGNLVFGSPITVRVTRECPLAATARNLSQTDTVRVCAVSTISRSQLNSNKQPALADLQWRPANAKRVRLFDDDTLVLLIEGPPSHQIASMLRLEDHFREEIQSKITQHGFVISSKATLAAIAVRCSHLGVFSLVLFSPGSEPSTPSMRLLGVVCVMNPAARSSILKKSAPFITQASGGGQLGKVSSRMAYSSFMSTLLSSGRLRDTIVNTPFATTADVESESKWDVDCEAVNRKSLCEHYNDPFVLWRTQEFIPNDSSGEAERPNMDGFNHREGQLRFWDVLPKWTLGDPAIIQLSLAATVDISTVRHRNETFSRYDYDDSQEGARAQALRVGLSVPQSAHEYLVSGHLVSSPASPSASFYTQEVVSAWRDQHGELFYTFQPSSRAEYVIQSYGHESHQFRETAMGSRVSQWKSRLHSFLWELLDGHQCIIGDLFERFLCGSESEGGHIQLRGFVSTLEGLGFNSEASTAPSKQEWLTLFTEIQCLAADPTPPVRVTRSVFKTFLIDPFHQLFWRHYMGILQSLATQDTIVQTLVAQFRPSDQDTTLQHRGKDTVNTVPWTDFVDSLGRFHRSLVRSSSTSHSTTYPVVVLSASDCCRLLYRFDALCNGWISAHLFQKSVVSSLGEVGKNNPSSASHKNNKQRTAVRNARRPNVDAFSTPNAIQKLFLARAQQQRKPQSPTTQPTIPSHAQSTRAALMYAGNTHLARIRSLPVSKLLREGVHFRPQLHDNEDTVAAAEQSF